MKIDKNYEKKVHKILKTYNSILVKCKNIPDLSEKNIIMVESMGGMINAQIETKKPILYFQENICISFMLLDAKEAYIYIVKANTNIQSEVEHAINNFQIAKNTFVKEILAKIENVLLSLNTDKQNLLTESELKYFDSIKQIYNDQNEDSSNSNKIQNSNKEESNKEANYEPNAKHSNNEPNMKNSSNNENEENSKGLYLIPIKKKKFSFFGKKRKNKKAKRVI